MLAPECQVGEVVQILVTSFPSMTVQSVGKVKSRIPGDQPMMFGLTNAAPHACFPWPVHPVACLVTPV